MIRAIKSCQDLLPSPLSQFEEWFQVAEQQALPQHNAMSLATVNAHGQPNVRMVLLKAYSESGFIFYTNLESPKSQALQHNPACSLVFYWAPLDRQIRIEGRATQLSREASEAYFHTRSRNSQIAAWVSQQSLPVESTEYLLEKYRTTQEKYANKDLIPLPPHWGGYQIVPHRYEFWVNGENRLHERFTYTKSETPIGWETKQLYP